MALRAIPARCWPIPISAPPQEVKRMIVRRQLVCLLLTCVAPAALFAQTTQTSVFGYADFAPEAKIEQQFLAVPDAKLAGQHLKTLTAEPHLAATPEDRKTAEYVADRFRAAGLDTEIVPYRVLLNHPVEQRIEAFDASGKLVYQETFPENCGSLAVMPASSPGRPETLLVGGTSHIWAY